MPSHSKETFAEPEAISLLSHIVDATPDQFPDAIAHARIFISEYRKRSHLPTMGSPCKVPPSVLRSIAYMSAQGNTQHHIASVTGISRDVIAYHLGPRSKAMRMACAETEINK